MSSQHALVKHVKFRLPYRLALFLVVFAALFVVIAPLWIIQPFRYQSPGALRFALLLIRWSPWTTLVCAILAFFFAIKAWPSGAGKFARIAKRTALVIAVALVCATVAASRINVFEKMFHPDLHPAFIAAAQSSVAPDDMVMAVRINGEARAYPIREMAYHHVLNDTVGGEPIVATY